MLSKRIKKPVSEILDIKNDAYLSFCINETAEYVYDKSMEKMKNDAELKSLMNKHSKKKK
jgi:hypothetical protein